MSMIRLRALLSGLTPDLPAADPEITRVVADSRQVRPGDLFVARRGVKTDAAAFAQDAVARGAVAVVAERALPGLGAPVAIVPDASEALGRLADRLEGEPSREVAVTGITGTNGKTTTAFLVQALLEAAGRPCSLLGTVMNRVAGREVAAAMTTPDAPAIHRAVAETRDAGWRDLAMEVSSHALDQRRVAGLRVRCAVFTNLTRDHLDYHGTLEAYGDAKARLFEDLAPDGAAVLNAHDAFSRVLARRTRARVVRYGWHEAGRPRPDAEVVARVDHTSLQGTRLGLTLGGEELSLVLPLVGPFNVENALAAAAAGWALGVAPRAVRDALAASPGVPGRLEPVRGAPGSPLVLVDYAHTPDALERVLSALRPLVTGRLRVVFGAGGDRDRGKRAPMGRAVERHADVAYVTSDNPRSEEPGQILSQVLAGFDRPAAARVIEDRAAAIAAAIAEADADDLVVLAGKGHEQGQVLADRTVPFDDRTAARAALGGRRAA
jgi:UDP-N-acetylmuramoyl-L-alanyl-D-glutamate--2,6-diaminopimelate ligase